MANADLMTYLLSRCERQPNGCLYWQGHRNASGYGRIAVNRRDWTVHRLVWTLIHGAIVDGLVVMHSCDQRRCCEQLHLSLGTIANCQGQTRQRQCGWQGQTNSIQSLADQKSYFTWTV